MACNLKRYIDLLRVHVNRSSLYFPTDIFGQFIWLSFLMLTHLRILEKVLNGGCVIDLVFRSAE